MEEFSKHIRDSVFGFVGVTELERQIIDSELFQRLRRVKQLGMANYVYPGAEHTRFAHSIGVLEVADRLFDRLMDACPPQAECSQCGTVSKQYPYPEHTADEARSKLRLAALVHDIGHFPFSHTIEPAMMESDPDLGNHESVGEHLVRSSEIGDLLQKNGFDVDEIVAIFRGRHPDIILNQLMHSQLDADRMDYLLRDSANCGVSYGQYDFDRLLHSLTLHNKQVAAEIGGLQTVEAYVMARYYMYTQVYVHHSVVGFNLLVEKAYKLMMEAGLVPDLKAILKSPALFMGLDDYLVMDAIKRVAKGTQPASPELKKICDSVYFRRPLKAVIDHCDFVETISGKAPQDLHALMFICANLDELRSKLGLGPYDVMTADPQIEISKFKPQVAIRRVFQGDATEKEPEADEMYIAIVDKKQGKRTPLELEQRSFVQFLANSDLRVIRLYSYPEHEDAVRKYVNDKVRSMSR
jgi:hypothetical protein